jgi:hypothetical protein
MTQQELATKIRSTAQLLSSYVTELDDLLRNARNTGMEVEVFDGINTEVHHDLDGLTAYKLKVGKIIAKLPL